MRKFTLRWLVSLLVIISFSLNSNAQYLTESFENAFPPTDWTILNNGSGNDWTQNTTSTNATDGSKSMKYAYNSSNAADAWAFTPALSLSSGAQIEIVFDFKTSYASGEKLKVTVGSAADVASQTETLFDNAAITNTNFQTETVTYTVPSDGNYYFAFNCYSDANEWTLYIDNILIGDAPTCPKPTDLTASNLAATTAIFSWNAGATETAWEVEYGESGFIQGNGTTVSATDTFFNATALSPDTDYEFYVRAVCGPGDESYWSNAYALHTEISCPEPSSLIASNITTTAATLSWLAEGSEGNWDVEYGDAGFTQGAGTTVSVTDTFASVTGLVTMTSYDFYVKAVCGSGDESVWVGPFNFMTACDAISSFPWTEDFESVSTPNLANCWSYINENGDTDYWKTYSGSSVTTISAGLYTDYNSGANDDYLVLPQFSLTGNEQLKYTVEARSTSEPNDYRVVLSTTGNSAADFTTELLPLTATSSIDQEEIIINLSAYTGDVYIAIHVPNGGLDGYYIYFDNFTVEELPACPATSFLTTSNLTATSATLSWFAGSSESEWNVEYGDAGFTQGAGTMLTATDTFTAVSALTPVSDYEFYVQAVCGPGDESTWTGPYSFTTPCQVETPDYVENFDGSWTPSCWVEAEGPVTGPTSTGSAGWFSATHNPTNSKVARINLYNTGDEDWLISPEFDLSTGGVYLTFDVYVSDYSGAPDAMGSDDEVSLLFTLDGGTTWNPMKTWNQATAPSNTGDHFALDMSLLPSTNVQFAFWATEGTADDIEDFYFSIDNFEIRPISMANDILTYSFPQQTEPATIDAAAHTVAIEVGNSIDLQTLVADFTLSPLATAVATSIDQESGVTINDFTNPVVYTVTAEDGSTSEDWTVTVTNALVLNEANIVDFSFPEQTGVATIDASAFSVNIEVNFMADLTALTPTIELSYGAITNQTFTDFSSPVVYTVIAEDGLTSSDWTVTVTQEAVPAGATCATAMAYANINDAEVVADINPASRELWFTVVLDQYYSDVDFSTCASAYDTKLYVYDACDATSYLYYDDDAPNDYCSADNNQSLIEVPLLAAGTYYVKIMTFGTSTDITDPTTGLLVTGTIALSPDAEILTYSIPSQLSSVIVPSNDSIRVAMPASADLSALVADFTLSAAAVDSVAGVVQASGVTANDWTVNNPIVHTVTAEDGTTRDWSVWVEIAGDEAEMLSFELAEQTAAGATFDIAARTIEVEVNFMATLTSLTPTYALSYGATTTQATTDFSAPVVYTIDSEDGLTSNDWTVTVTQEATPVGATCATAMPYTNINDAEVTTTINATSRELWFTVVLDQDYQTVQFSTCPSVYDTKLYIYDACDANHIGYNDDAPDDFCSVDVNQSLVELSDLVAGTYYVKVTPFSSTTNIVDDATTGLLATGTNVGIETVEFNSEVKVYPNPNNGQFNIALNLEKEATIEVVNTLGQVVANFDNVDANNTITMDLSNEATGLYIVRITSDNNTITKKVNVIR